MQVVYKEITRAGEKSNAAKWILIGEIQFKQENKEQVIEILSHSFFSH